MSNKSYLDRIWQKIEELRSMLNIASSDVIFCTYSDLEDLRSILDILKETSKDITFHEVHYEKDLDLAGEIFRILKTTSFRYKKLKSGIEKKKLVFSIFDLEKLLEMKSIETLNIYRDFFLRTEYPILIWLNDLYIDRFALEAPDFWRIRTKVFFFPSKSFEDPYAKNVDRILSAFGSLGNDIKFRSNKIERNLENFTSSIKGWLIYTEEGSWKKIGYDGPQVPRYPFQTPHDHKLSWEARKMRNFMH